MPLIVPKFDGPKRMLDNLLAQFKDQGAGFDPLCDPL